MCVRQFVGSKRVWRAQTQPRLSFACNSSSSRRAAIPVQLGIMRASQLIAVQLINLSLSLFALRLPQLQSAAVSPQEKYTLDSLNELEGIDEKFRWSQPEDGREVWPSKLQYFLAITRFVSRLELTSTGSFEPLNTDNFSPSANSATQLDWAM